MEREIRAFPAKFSVRKTAGGPVKISGYAAVFNRLSEDLGGFREKIAPGAFRGALKTSDVRALINHDPNQIVGRTGVNLTLTEDRTGLHMTLTAPDKPSARFDQLVSDVENGLITQQSFGFRMPANQAGESWDKEDGEQIRTITRVEELLDCSPCTFPAYPDTSVAKRTLASLSYSKTGAVAPRKARKMNLKQQLRDGLDALEKLSEKDGAAYWRAVGMVDEALEALESPVLIRRDGLRTVAAYIERDTGSYVAPDLSGDDQRSHFTAGTHDYEREYEPTPKGFGLYLGDLKRAMSPGGARSARLDALEQRAAGTGQTAFGAPSDGGFLVQDEHVSMIGEHFKSNGILSRCRTFFPEGNSIRIPMVDESSRADGSRQGGLQAYWASELSQYTSSAAKFKTINMTMEKLTAMVFCSDEILEDYQTLGQFVSESLARELLFKLQDAIINGVGAGQPLGILNSGALVSISAETGQAVDTIVSENVLKMYARFQPSGLPGGCCWLANRNILPMLWTMSYDIGTGGELARLYQPGAGPDSIGSMLGYPVIFIEQCPTLGDAGDLMLCDLKQYLLLMKRGGPKVDMSIHLKFDYGQSTFRATLRCEGQPALDSPVTPYKGTGDTVGPFVAIAAR